MKFMKLGSRPDTFCTTEAERSVTSGVSSDLIIQVKGSRYLLHKVNYMASFNALNCSTSTATFRKLEFPSSFSKDDESWMSKIDRFACLQTQFPLLSKCLLLQMLCSESPGTSHIQPIKLPDFPVSVEAFELCAKFCYGITITLSAYNIVSIRYAAEYLQMTENADRGNLIYKVEVFFNSCILHGWRDLIVTLQSTKAFPMFSEDLGLTSRCIEAIASKVIAHPSKVSLSQSYSRRGRDDLWSNGSESHRHNSINSKLWWGEDFAELGIDLYWRTMVAIKSGGKVPSNLIGDALRIYASRWLPDISKCMNTDKHGEANDCEVDSKYRLLLESIVSLLPAEKGAVSCSFLLKLLNAANILKASSSSQTELTRSVGLQLEEATVGDLLVPCLSSRKVTMYDIDVFMTILEQFMLQGQSPPTSPPRNEGRLERRRSRSVEHVDFEFQESRRSSSASHSSKLKVAKLIDGYLQEIAKEKNLPLSKFIAIAEVIPEFARVDHDDLYKAIDIYLKGHPELNKIERKQLCGLIDCKKLSVEACMHAAQNEMLPLRVVVQILFFEQARATMACGRVTELPSNVKALLDGRKTPSKIADSFNTNATMPPEDQWSVSGLKSLKSNLSTLKMKLAEDHDLDHNFPDRIVKSSKLKSISMIPNIPKRIFRKFWPISSTSQTN